MTNGHRPTFSHSFLPSSWRREEKSVSFFAVPREKGEKTNLEQRTDMPMTYFNYFKGPTLTTPLFGYRREIGYYV